jgi:hypothetical protein
VTSQADLSSQAAFCQREAVRSRLPKGADRLSPEINGTKRSSN